MNRDNGMLRPVQYEDWTLDRQALYPLYIHLHYLFVGLTLIAHGYILQKKFLLHLASVYAPKTMCADDVA